MIFSWVFKQIYEDILFLSFISINFRLVCIDVLWIFLPSVFSSSLHFGLCLCLCGFPTHFHSPKGYSARDFFVALAGGRLRIPAADGNGVPVPNGRMPELLQVGTTKVIEYDLIWYKLQVLLSIIIFWFICLWAISSILLYFVYL